MEKIDLSIKTLPYGAMLWWSECEDAARYIVKLSIMEFIHSKLDGVYRLCEIEKDRNTFFHTFIGLADGTRNNSPKGIEYVTKIVAEGRNGEVIAESENIEFSVSELPVGGFGGFSCLG